MGKALKLEIVTPDATVYSEPVESVILRGVEGQMTILPQHIRLMTQLVPGELIVRKGGQDEYLAVGEGLVVVTGDHVAIVTDMAVAAAEIAETKAPGGRPKATAPLRARTLLTAV